MSTKVLLLLTPLVFGVSYFVVWQRELSFPLISSIASVLFALPALIGIKQWLGWSRGVLLFLSLGVFSYTIESVGLLTGFPYGEFSYSPNVGILLFNFLPIALPFAWVPLMIGAVAIVINYRGDFLKFCFMSLLWLVSIDIILDPGAVFLGFWSYSQSGDWYGVPISNYLGWVVSGAIGFFIMWLFIRKVKKGPPTYTSFSYFYSLIFWTGVCTFGQIWGGVIVGVAIILFFLRAHFLLESTSKTNG